MNEDGRIIPEIEEIGESFDVADDANVPVNIFLSKEEDELGDETDRYLLIASNYMPLKDRVNLEMYCVASKDPEALRKIVSEKVIPLYEAALAQLHAIVEGKSEDLLIWKAPESSEKSE